MQTWAPIAAAILLASPTAACSQQANDPAYAEEVAASVDRDCYPAGSQAPNAAFAHHLDRLCACLHAKIAATPMTRNDSDEARNAKIQAGTNACTDELGGTPDAEDYRAAGLKPPANPLAGG